MLEVTREPALGPMYLQIANALEARVQDGTYAHGDKLPLWLAGGGGAAVRFVPLER